MKTKKNTIMKTSLIFVKNRSLNCDQVSKQTSKMRDITNAQIRDLGEKYYQTKLLFDKLKLSRDYLFYIGRQIENEFKDSKKIIHLQTQQYRMKESLVCWFALNFYEDIFSNESEILCKLIMHSRDKEFSKKKINTQTDIPQSNQTISAQSQEISTQNIFVQNINISHETNKNIDNNNSFFNEIKVNHEIDEFNYGNIKNENIKEIINQNNNFDFFEFLK